MVYLFIRVIDNRHDTGIYWVQFGVKDEGISQYGSYHSQVTPGSFFSGVGLPNSLGLEKEVAILLGTLQWYWRYIRCEASHMNVSVYLLFLGSHGILVYRGHAGLLHQEFVVIKVCEDLGDVLVAASRTVVAGFRVSGLELLL